MKKGQLGKHIKFLTVMVIAGIMFWFCPAAEAVTASPVISVTTPSVQVQPGEDVVIPVKLTSDGSVRGIQFDVVYNPALLLYKETAEGSLTKKEEIWSTTGSGRISIMIVNTGAQSCIPGGTGSVAVVKFQVLSTAAAGSCSLSVQDIVMSGDDGNHIPVAVVQVDGQFAIGGSNPPLVPPMAGGGGVPPLAVKTLEIDRLNPADKSAGVALDVPVSAVFKEEISALDLSGVSITGGNGNKVSGVKAAVNGKTLTIAHDRFQYETVYTVNIPANVVYGSDGVKNSELVWTFTTVKKPAPTVKAGFSDVADNHWAYGIINDLSARGIIGGYPDGTFKPGNDISRAEFVAILCKAMGLLPETAQSRFADVNPGDWFYGCVQAAAKAGIVSGYGSEFRPEMPVTRQEIAVILVRALGLEKEALASSAKETSFIDDSNLDAWARGFVVIAVQKGIVGGYPDNTFAPRGKATRAEACAMIFRFIELMK